MIVLPSLCIFVCHRVRVHILHFVANVAFLDLNFIFPRKFLTPMLSSHVLVISIDHYDC